MGCSEYGGYQRPGVEIITRLFHLLRMIELSDKHPYNGGLASSAWVRQSGYVGEEKASEFYYRYFIPHNKG